MSAYPPEARAAAYDRLDRYIREHFLPFRIFPEDGEWLESSEQWPGPQWRFEVRDLGVRLLLDAEDGEVLCMDWYRYGGKVTYPHLEKRTSTPEHILAVAEAAMRRYGAELRLAERPLGFYAHGFYGVSEGPVWVVHCERVVPSRFEGVDNVDFVVDDPTGEVLEVLVS